MSRWRSPTTTRLAAVLLMGFALSACNPLLGDPTNNGDLELVGARYTGPSPAWIELSVAGAPDVTVFAFAAVEIHDLQGPSARSCAGDLGAVIPCQVSTAFVGMPNQLIVTSGGPPVRMMTAWSGERVQVVLVCVDAQNELICPDSLRTGLGAVDDSGPRIGDLVPA